MLLAHDETAVRSPQHLLVILIYITGREISARSSKERHFNELYLSSARRRRRRRAQRQQRQQQERGRDSGRTHVHTHRTWGRAQAQSQAHTRRQAPAVAHCVSLTPAFESAAADGKLNGFRGKERRAGDGTGIREGEGRERTV